MAPAAWAAASQLATGLASRGTRGFRVGLTEGSPVPGSPSAKARAARATVLAVDAERVALGDPAGRGRRPVVRP